MKTIQYYEITKEQADNTEYRPLNVETTTVETEDDWNMADVITNNDPYDVTVIADCNDIIVYRAHNVETDETHFVVEIK